MSCYKPWVPPSHLGLPPHTKLACGRCIGCKLQRSNEWATRCSHEASLHTYNSFLTLTIDDNHLRTQSLNHRIYQLFMKRVRNALGRIRYANAIAISESLYQYEVANSRSATSLANPRETCMGFHPIPRLKYYMAGEYGSRTRRPHFHACLFGISFNDKKYYATGKGGARIYTSDTLQKLWGQGFSTVGEVTYESAAYIARYIMDKKTGQDASNYYQHINWETGEITDLKPEYNKMSLKTAIGKEWLEKYTTDVYPDGNVITRGKKNKAPKYYDKIWKKKEPNKFADMKRKRKKEQIENSQDNTPERLKTKETVKKAQLNKLLREL